MKKTKRYLMDAYRAFRETPEYRKINPLLGEEGVKREYKLYDKLYPLFDTEDEINKEFCDYVKAWSENPEYRSASGARVYLDSGYDTYRRLKRPEDTGNGKLTSDDIRSRRSDQYTNPDAEKLSEAEKNSREALEREAFKNVNAAKAEVDYERMKEEADRDRKSKKESGNKVSAYDLHGFEDAVQMADKIKQITGVPVSSKNWSDVVKQAEALNKSGNIEAYTECKRAALTISKIYDEMRKSRGVSKDHLKIVKDLYGYCSGLISHQSKLKGEDTVGTDNEKRLIKLYQDTKKVSDATNTSDPKSLMETAKMIWNSVAEEEKWQAQCDSAGLAEAKKRSLTRYDDANASGGYAVMWTKCFNAINSIINTNPYGGSEAYLNVQPWPSSSPAIKSPNVETTWGELANYLKEQLKADESAQNAEKNTNESVADDMLNQARSNINNVDNAMGSTTETQPQSEAQETYDEQKKKEKGASWLDKAKNIFGGKKE